MKRILAIGMFCSLSGLSAWAAPQTLTGQISDSMCGKSHSGMGEMGENPKECTLGCVKSGDKVYDIKNQTFAGLDKNAGGTVMATGEVSTDGKSITLTKLSAAAAK